MTPTNEPSTEVGLGAQLQGALAQRYLAFKSGHTSEAARWDKESLRLAREIDAEITTLTDALTEARAALKRAQNERLQDHRELLQHEHTSGDHQGYIAAYYVIKMLDAANEAILAQSILKDAPSDCTCRTTMPLAANDQQRHWPHCRFKIDAPKE